jgi:predicted transcriptional regulator
MDEVWARDAVTGMTVRDIFDSLSAARAIAYTTVMSTMDNLHTKGWLSRQREGKAYRYRPILTREQHTARLMREALTGGGHTDMVLSYFVQQMDADESESLREALRRLTQREQKQ